ncbi:IclR family transcriptional regulator, partial [Mesorhizobium sp. M7A.F.Ca.ET.027.02.1.1]
MRSARSSDCTELTSDGPLKARGRPRAFNGPSEVSSVQSLDRAL